MRITCPHCGARDVSEFAYLGAAGGQRPDGMEASVEAMTDYVHLRDNPAGPHREFWHHGHGCRAVLIVTRDTLSHEVLHVAPAREASSPGSAET